MIDSALPNRFWSTPFLGDHIHLRSRLLAHIHIHPRSPWFIVSSRCSLSPISAYRFCIQPPLQLSQPLSSFHDPQRPRRMIIRILYLCIDTSFLRSPSTNIASVYSVPLACCIVLNRLSTIMLPWSCFHLFIVTWHHSFIHSSIHLSSLFVFAFFSLGIAKSWDRAPILCRPSSWFPWNSILGYMFHCSLRVFLLHELAIILWVSFSFDYYYRSSERRSAMTSLLFKAMPIHTSIQTSSLSSILLLLLGPFPSLQLSIRSPIIW